MGRRLLGDVETDGLLDELTRVHCLWLHDIDTDERFDFARNEERDDIEEGLKLLEEAEMFIGHNVIDFDIRAIKKVYPKFEMNATIRDTLVMSRTQFADVKEKDFQLYREDKLPGRLIGLHGLEAWGYRTGQNKGDYAKEKEKELKEMHKASGFEPPSKQEITKHVWGKWNPQMHQYCSDDLDVNLALLDLLIDMPWDMGSTEFEHEVHSLMVVMEENGFPFNKAGAEALAEKLRIEYDTLHAEAVEGIGTWWRPTRYRTTDEGIDLDMGEFDRRRTWGRIDVPKRTSNFAKSNSKLVREGNLHLMRPNTVKDAPFVKVVLREFNPGSRQQIVDRLKVLHGWTPQDFTEKGNAIVDDEILRNLEDHVPIAGTLAELFFLKKRLGQIADGNNAWLKLMKSDHKIHARTNCGGTVSGRATHSRPNISQVPGVKMADTDNEEEARVAALRLGIKFSDIKYNESKGEYAWIEKGREGEYGWECRELFTAVIGYKLVGSDLSGIEFRCLGNLTAPFDDGKIIDLVLNGDIHQHNADLAGIARFIAKRLLYACMYGAGDAKLGSIVEPLASEAKQRTLGKQLRAKLLAAMPSLAEAIKEIQKEARFNKGTIRGMDGRRLYVRSPHSALNLRLQSDGAMIAKKWILLIDEMFRDEGWQHHVDKDYAFAAWSHDEIQIVVKEELASRAAELMVNAAPRAGEYFDFKCPVAAESKIGSNWAETH